MLGLKPDRGVISAMVVLALVWLGFKLGGPAVQLFVLDHLALHPARAIGPEPWQLFTATFLELGVKNLLFTGVTLIFFGNLVEQLLGARGFWKIFVVGGIAGNLLAALLGRFIAPGATLLGSQEATTSLLVAYAVLMDRRQVNAYGVMQVSGSVIAWIWVGISAIGFVVDLFGSPMERIGAELGMAAMVGAGLAGWLLTRGGRGVDVRGSLDKVRLWRLKRRYKVLTGGRSSQDDKRYLN